MPMRYRILYPLLLIPCIIILHSKNGDVCYTKRMNPQKEDKGSIRLLTFYETMKTFPWSDFEDAVSTADWEGIRKNSNLLASKVYRFITMEPNVPSNISCHPPPFRIPNCTILNNPRKVAVLFKFGFDVDALEIHLNELDELVQRFFIIESVVPHSDIVTDKPLMWELIKFQPRFSRFLPKIIHFIVDDASATSQMRLKPRTNKFKNNSGKTSWSSEQLTTRMTWQKFLEWNKISKEFGPSDLIGIGYVDEIPNRDNIYQLKYCHEGKFPVDIGIWFPFPHIDSAFTPDQIIKGYKYTIAVPTYWRLSEAFEYFRRYKTTPYKEKGKSPRFLLGGMHFSKYPYPPFQVIKTLTSTETSRYAYMQEIVKVGQLYQQNRVDEAAINLSKLYSFGISQRRFYKLDKLRGNDALWEKERLGDIVKLLWYYDCNRQRYPSFQNMSDSRLQ